MSEIRFEVKSAEQAQDLTKVYETPAKLIITSHQGIGKTSACSQLPNSLIVDLEGGWKSYFGGNCIDIKAIADTNNIPIAQAFVMFLKDMRVQMEANNKALLYDFIIFDNLSSLDNIIRTKATKDFKMGVVGKGMLGKGTVINDVVTDVPESGWMWYFKAYEELYSFMTGLAKTGTIFLAHSKQGSLVKEGNKLEATDINLSGKVKIDLLRDVDACGTLYRDKEGKCVLSFKTNTRDLTTKTRSPHLSEKEILLSEIKDNKLNTYWSEIFHELKTN